MKADSGDSDRLWCVEWHSEISSTMDRASELAAADAPSGYVVVADFQKEGRGTHGRVWLAPPGTCLMFTTLVRPEVSPSDLSRLPLRVAESVANAIAGFAGLQIDVQEPNDLVINGKKVCGVLCTSRIVGEKVEWVLVGIGLNTNMQVDELPLDSATSLSIERGGVTLDHGHLLQRLLGSLSWLRGSGVPSCAGYADKPILSNYVQ